MTGVILVISENFFEWNDPSSNDKMSKDYVKNAYDRCVKYGVEEDLIVSKRIIDSEKLNRKLLDNKDLIITAKPFINQLYDFVEGSDFFIILTDKDGCILSITGDEKILDRAKSLMMIPGAYMDEKNIGTNAMGTALAENRPVQISGAEHFIKVYHRWTCSGAPIHDEHGNIIGALDLTGNCDCVHSHTLGMVVAAVKAIESIMRLNAKNQLLRENSALIESLFDSIQDGIIHCDLEGKIISNNEQAGRMFGRKRDKLMGTNISSLIDDWDNIKKATLSANGYHDEDVKVNVKMNKLYYNLNSYTISEDNQEHGIILMFKDVKRVRKLANKIMGRKAIYTFDKIIGQSNAMLDVIDFAKKVSDSKSTVLITGESGCGKEVFAQAIQNHSPRRNEPFVVINCGAIPRNLMESELFGYDEGAFTGAKRGGQVGKFEVADGGTIFLDEIGEMPLEMQTKLLRVIEEGTIVRVGSSAETPVNVRIIAATNKRLKDEVKKGNFRHDLYYRLNVIPIELPPLRERREDIPKLTDYFMDKISHRINKKPVNISDAEMSIIKAYQWPGNVRELENFIELAINKEKLPLNLISTSEVEASIAEESYRLISIEEMEKYHIKRVLQEKDYNITSAAKILGVGRNTLYRKLDKHNIDYDK